MEVLNPDRLVETPPMDDGVPGLLTHVDVEGESLHGSAGHRLHTDEQKQGCIRPSQKVGIEYPTYEKSVIAWSNTE